MFSQTQINSITSDQNQMIRSNYQKACAEKVKRAFFLEYASSDEGKSQQAIENYFNSENAILKRELSDLKKKIFSADLLQKALVYSSLLERKIAKNCFLLCDGGADNCEMFSFINDQLLILAHHIQCQETFLNVLPLPKSDPNLYMKVFKKNVPYWDLLLRQFGSDNLMNPEFPGEFEMLSKLDFHNGAIEFLKSLSAIFVPHLRDYVDSKDTILCFSFEEPADLFKAFMILEKVQLLVFLPSHTEVFHCLVYVSLQDEPFKPPVEKVMSSNNDQLFW